MVPGHHFGGDIPVGAFIQNERRQLWLPYESQEEDWPYKKEIAWIVSPTIIDGWWDVQEKLTEGYTPTSGKGMVNSLLFEAEYKLREIGAMPLEAQ